MGSEPALTDSLDGQGGRATGGRGIHSPIMAAGADTARPAPVVTAGGRDTSGGPVGEHP